MREMCWTSSSWPKSNRWCRPHTSEGYYHIGRTGICLDGCSVWQLAENLYSHILNLRTICEKNFSGNCGCSQEEGFFLLWFQKIQTHLLFVGFSFISLTICISEFKKVWYSTINCLELLKKKKAMQEVDNIGKNRRRTCIQTWVYNKHFNTDNGEQSCF